MDTMNHLFNFLVTDITCKGNTANKTIRGIAQRLQLSDFSVFKTYFFKLVFLNIKGLQSGGLMGCTVHTLGETGESRRNNLILQNYKEWF